MKNDAGFTLMETLLSTAIILIVSCLLVVAFSVTLKSSAQSLKTVQNAVLITHIDRFIRERTERLHIPYWANPGPYADELGEELFRSKYGSYIKSVTPLRDAGKKIRGLTVVYVVGSSEMTAAALFPSIPVMEPRR
jgi:prepilin-type N-terminal cleavage/methylation domain-containing protein